MGTPPLSHDPPVLTELIGFFFSVHPPTSGRFPLHTKNPPPPFPGTPWRKEGPHFVIEGRSLFPGKGILSSLTLDVEMYMLAPPDIEFPQKSTSPNMV